MDEMAKFLLECCSRRLPATIASKDSVAWHKAYFSRLLPRYVEFELESDLTPFRYGSICIVSFQRATTEYVFLSAVRTHNRTVKPARLMLSRPYGISQESRHAFRILAEEIEGLSVQLKPPSGKLISPRPINISAAGILLEFDPPDIPDLEPGDALELALTFQGRVFETSAIVRHGRGNQLGLYFGQDLSQAGAQPVHALLELMDLIEDL